MRRQVGAGRVARQREAAVPRRSLNGSFEAFSDDDAEKYVLGALLENERAVLDLASDVEPELFFFPKNRVILQAILDLHERGEPLHIITLTDLLRRNGNLDQVGGPAEVTTLATTYSTGIAVAKSQIELLRELTLKRKLHEVICESLKNVNDVTIGGREAVSRIQDAVVILGRTLAPNRRNLIEFKTPSEIQSYVPPPGLVLVGDCHITRGLVFIIAGPPGVGKSRASVALAQAGAKGVGEWFGLRVHNQFRTMILQNENGMFRLSQEFAAFDPEALDEWIRICPPPPLGLCFERTEFKQALRREIEKFKPDVVLLDPWNAVARDEKARDYRETFDSIRDVIPAGDESPALGIVAHTRKPKTDERPTGRALLNEIAGSYIIGSVARSVFVMQSATDDPEETRIVWSCCKNNDGDLGPRSAWIRRNGLFDLAHDFDWDSFNAPDRAPISADDLENVFNDQGHELTRAEIVAGLQNATGLGRSSCYNAIKRHLGQLQQRPGGKFAWGN
jgi:hypothetical protein